MGAPLVKVQGDFAQLRQLAQKVSSLADARFKRDVRENLALTAHAEVMRSFEQAVDPYGAKWAPLKHRKGHPLQDTRRLMSSIRSRATSDGFRISSNVVYAAIHNYGGTISRKGGVVAREADSGRYLRRSLKATGQREFQVQGQRAATRIGFNRAYQGTIPRRQYLPSEGELGRRWHGALSSQMSKLLLQQVGR